MGFLNKIFGNKKEVSTPGDTAIHVSPPRENEEGYQYVLAAMEAEKSEEIDKALTLYEASLLTYYEGNKPYDRLAILYRKRKMIDDEIRVLKLGIKVFEELKANGSGRSDLEPKIQKFQERLEKARKLI